jgi:hypothetical protein
MVTPQATWSFAKCLEQVQQMRQIWTAAGLRMTNNRIDRYERELKRLVELWPDKLTNNLTEEQARDIILTFAEIVEFLFVSNVVPSRPHLMAHPRLREAFSGAPLSGQEAKTLPRDTLFELTIASLLERAGLTADVTAGSDVETVFEVPVCVECKRVQSLDAIEARLLEGDRQLRVRLPQCGQGALGIVALSVTKAFTKGSKRLQVANAEQIEGAMTQVAIETAKEINKHRAKLQSCEAIIMYASVAGTSGTPFVYTQIGISKKLALSPERDELIERLMNRLQQVRSTV